MKAIEIGMTGKLGKETLTVVSFTSTTFTCDNGKSYVTAYSKWMTDGIVTGVKVKKATNSNMILASKVEEELTLSERRRIEDYIADSRNRQAGSSLR